MDDQIDQLYQLPLGQFTPARNVLAKAAGPRAAEIKGLEKPNAAAWAVNQLFWRERPIYDELIEASQQLRTAYRQQLAGESPDVRAAEVAENEARTLMENNAALCAELRSIEDATVTNRVKRGER